MQNKKEKIKNIEEFSINYLKLHKLVTKRNENLKYCYAKRPNIILIKNNKHKLKQQLYKSTKQINVAKMSQTNHQH